jgi:hypothetical protein
MKLMSGSESKGCENSGLAKSGIRRDMKLHAEKREARSGKGWRGEVRNIRPDGQTCRERILTSIGSGAKKRTPENFDFFQEF